MGDDFVYRDDGRNEIADFIAEWQKCDAQSAMMVSEVAVEDAPRYGIVMTNEEGNYKEVLEKPSIEIAKTLIEPQITISKYIFGAGMKRYVHEFVARNKPAGEEYYIFDPMDAAVAEGHKFHTYHIKGEYLDGGNPQSWLYANQVVTH
jgi:UTP-glucose-1-phosphate uridylyltransferase